MIDNTNPTPNPSNTPHSSEPPVVKATLPKNPLWWIAGLLFTALFVTVAVVAGYNLSNNKAKKDLSALESQLTALQSNAHELPAGSVKLSDCIPNMGSHYATKSSDPEYGPFILVNKTGKVIGLEYMAVPDMYTPIPGTVPPVELITKASSLYGWKFDHIEFSHLPKGHPGLLKDHIDVHLFTVTPEQQKQACT